MALTEMMPLEQDGSEGEATKSRWPTKKWWAALITVAGSWVANLITAGAFTKVIAIALVGIVSQMTVAYLVPNDNARGGVPLCKKAKE